MKCILLNSTFPGHILSLLLLISSQYLLAAPNNLNVRPALKAGSWYPAQASELAGLIDDLLNDKVSNRSRKQDTINTIIVPHAAYHYSGETAAVAYRLLKGKHYQRVVLLGPAHMAGQLSGLFILDVDAYETPLGSVSLDQDAITQLRRSPVVRTERSLHLNEHSLEIQLPFLQRALKPDWQLVPVLVANMEPADYLQAAAALKPLLDENTLLVISTDFTHYGKRFDYEPFPLDRWTARRIYDLDMGAFARITARDPFEFLRYRHENGITICGYHALTLALHLIPSATKMHLLEYKTSGELTGDYSHSVSYIAVVVTSHADN